VHRHGLVHRDIKPVNVLFPDGDIGRAKLIDFGIVRRIREPQALTRTGTVIGTPSYMAPEQAVGAREIDARVDVFALGCVLYECLTGCVAFAGANMMAVRARLLLTEPPSLETECPEAPPAVADLLARMLAKDPARRPASGTEVAALLATLGDLPDGTRRRARPLDTTPTRNLGRPAWPGAHDTAGVISVVMIDAHDGHDPEGGEAPAHVEALRRAAAPHGGKLELLAGGAAVVMFAGPNGAEVAERAVSCALAFSAAVPGARVAVASVASGEGPGVADVGAALDRGAHTIEQLSLQQIFVDFRPAADTDAVSIDEATAQLLPEHARCFSTAHGYALRVPK